MSVSGYRKVSEVLNILFGVGAIIVGLALEVDSPWLYICGAGLIVWGVWDIYKEHRDSSKASDVADMEKQREEISKKLGGEK